MRCWLKPKKEDIPPPPAPPPNIKAPSMRNDPFITGMLLGCGAVAIIGVLVGLYLLFTIGGV